jgi:hypothetical protein
MGETGMRVYGTSNYNGIPAMSPPSVHEYLEDLGREWTGQGVAMEVGCWLGATSAALLTGLVEAGYDKPFWAFDRWRINESEVQKAHEQGVDLHLWQDIESVYLKNITSIYAEVQTVKGKIPHTFKKYSKQPIEFCMFDAPKCDPIFSMSVNYVLQYFIPGVTVFGLLDYYHYVRRRDTQHRDWEKFLAPVEFIEQHPENFTMLREFPDDGSCVFFRYEKQIR